MKIIYGPRRSGKTTRLIQISNERQIPIIVHSKEESNRIFFAAQKMDLHIPRPLTFSDLDRMHGIHETGVLVDHVDWLLQHFLNERGVRATVEVSTLAWGSAEKLKLPNRVTKLINRLKKLFVKGKML